jgi:DNA-binding GntR family transcriptional regulator
MGNPCTGASLRQSGFFGIRDIFASRQDSGCRFGIAANLPETAPHLRILYDKLYIIRRSGDVAAIAKAATEFSGYMLKIADHELIGDLHRKLIARMSALRGVSISQPGRLAQAASELAAVMRAIERRDAESAAQCFAIHVRNAGEAALARIDAGPLPSYVPMHDQPA